MLHYCISCISKSKRNQTDILLRLLLDMLGDQLIEHYKIIAMADLPKTSILSGQTNTTTPTHNKPSEQTKTTSLFPPPGPSLSDSFVMPPKQSTSMLASITVPIPLNKKTTASFNQGQSKEQKKETVQPLKVAAPENKSNVQGQKTGGTLSGPPQTIAVRTNAQQVNQRERQGVQKIERQMLVMSTLMDKLFFKKTIENNSAASDSDLKAFVGIYGKFCTGQKERQESLKKLKDVAERRKTLQIKYLKNQKDEKVLDKVQQDFCVIIKRLFEKLSYINVEACVFLIEQYVRLNETTYYPNGKFIHKELRDLDSNFQASPRLSHIVRQIETILQNIFLKYEQMLQLLVSKSLSKDRQHCLFLQKLLKSQELLRLLGYDIWKSFETVTIAQKKKEKGGNLLSYSFQLNILLNCLNLYNQLRPIYFTQQIVLNRILPALRDSLYLFEGGSSIATNSIDQLVLTLLLVHPYTLDDLKTAGLKQFLMGQKIRDRYPYLCLLPDDRFNPAELAPLNTYETAIFLQQYISIVTEINWYEPSKHAFIFKSICNIFKNNPSSNVLNRKKYPQIYQYIDYVIHSIFTSFKDQSQSDKDEDQYSYIDRYLGACRLAKLISSLCLSTKGRAINTHRFAELIKGDSQIVTELLSICFEIVKMDGAENQECNNSMSEYQISTEEVYELLFRLMIYDSRYFQLRSAHIKAFFQSVHQFYVSVIVSYVSKFIEYANYSHLNLYALAELVSTHGYFPVCKEIFDELSSLKNYDVQILDQFQKKFNKTELQFAVEKILSLRPQTPNPFPAVAHLLLSVLHHNPAFLQSQWLRALTSQIKRLIDINHPIILTRYAQMLIEVLNYLSRNSSHLREVQSHFEFRFINIFLCHALSFQFQRQSPKVCNKLMRNRQYNLVKIAVRLIKEMTSLYLKEKEDGQERVPLQVKRMLQLENKGGHYQLLFSKEATSYNVALIVVLLSREIVLDHYLRKKEPSFRDNIFQALTNLNLISSMLRYDVSLKIHHLYNRHLEIQINQGLNLKEAVLDQIKWSPSFTSLEYLMSWNEFKLYLKKELFDKVKDLQSCDKVQGLQTKAHFLQVYWKNIASKQLRISQQEAWAYTDGFLKSFQLRSEEVDLSQFPQIAQQISSNIFKLSMFIKGTSLNTYAQFLLNYNKYFFQYMKQAQGLEDLKCSPLTDQFHQAIVCFFNIKSILTPSLFDPFTKDSFLSSNLFLFLVEVLERRTKLRQSDEKHERETMMEIVMYGVGFLLDIAVGKPDLMRWLADILKLVVKNQPVAGEMSTKKILLIIVLRAKLGQSLSYYELNFDNHHWLLLANIMQNSQKLSEVLLLDLPSIYNSHPIYFVSACHYFVNAAKTSCLSRLSRTSNISLHKGFIDSLVAIFHKTIKETKCYYSVWIVQILSEMVVNEEVPKDQRQKYYEQIRKIILESQVLHDRIAFLLGKVAANVGFEMKDIRGCWRWTTKVDKHISLGQKIELIAYFRLITLIYFNYKHQSLSVARERNGYCESASLLEKEKDIFLSITSMLPLLSKLMNPKNDHLEATTDVQKQLNSINLENFYSKSLKQSVLRQQSKIQIHEIWPRDTSALDLLNYISNFQLVSICSVWLGDIVNSKEGKFSIHHEILKHEIFDRTINNLITLMDEAEKALQPYEKYKETIQPLLQQFKQTIYTSITLSKEMHFTNTSTLNSYLSFNFEDVSSQLSQIVVGVHKIIKKVFEEAKRGAIKVKAESNFRAKERNLRTVERMLKNIDTRFFQYMDRSTHRNESEYLSRNFTKTIF